MTRIVEQYGDFFVFDDTHCHATHTQPANQLRACLMNTDDASLEAQLSVESRQHSQQDAAPALKNNRG